eukprot:CAMPEP_0115231648 /NCGR_PEP_ID=MMETSP0270-20121206/33347_1 /TAXON_ID=71861 /ORGANISM="Scrippsiella trochoidea, Strain CCMP3099" /LENGTH=43 /DNA_ID= /DNA_START= /DNA_END= /DNA_ORIENTATION=
MTALMQNPSVHFHRGPRGNPADVLRRRRTSRRTTTCATLRPQP